RECGNAVPIAFVRADRNHGIVSRTASERTGPRIPDPLSGFVAFRILILTIVVGVMPDKVVPLLALIFCGQRVKGRNDIICVLLFAACLKKKDSIPGIR